MNTPKARTVPAGECLESAELPGLFRGDPADQIIVATARLLSVPVVTRDRRILDCAHVPTIW